MLQPIIIKQQEENEEDIIHSDLISDPLEDSSEEEATEDIE